MVAASITDFGPQTNPLAVNYFTATTLTSGLARPSIVVHPSFTLKTM
jgi:hypothetical protein